MITQYEKKYCTYCGGSLEHRFIEGRERLHCSSCNKITYANPIPASSVVIFDNNRILLVLRSVDPQKGMWCLPGGFIEIDESSETGALRELEEETGLTGRISELIGVFSQFGNNCRSVLLTGYIVEDVSGELHAGDDADEVRYFDINNLPELAFESHKYFIDKAIPMKFDKK